MAVHTDASLAEIEILPDLYFTAREERIARVVRENQHPYKIFRGYTGWGPNQLEHEVARGVWRTTPASLIQVFSHREDLWHEVHRQALESVVDSLFGVKHRPRHPLAN